MELIIDQGWFLPEQLISPHIGPSLDPYNSSSTLSCMDSSNTTQSNKNMKKKKKKKKRRGRSNNNTSDLRQAMRAYSPPRKKNRTSNGAEDDVGQHQSLTLKMAGNPDSDQESSSSGTITSACFQAKGTSTSALVVKERRRPFGAAKLVWVSTMKGVGRKIIHGVMYRSGENAKVICHCHRRHLSMAQFVLHGGGSPTQIANPLMNIVVRTGFS